MPLARLPLPLTLFLTATRLLHAAPTAQDKQDDARLILEVTVTGKAGQPVSKAQAFIANETANPLTKRWDVADDAGRIVIAKRSLRRLRGFPDEPAKLLVRAAGYGWAVETVDLSKTRKHRIVLPPARSITMNITREDGAPIPSDLQPIIFAEGWAVAAWISGVQYVDFDMVEDVFSAAQVKRDGDRFIFDVPAEPQPIWILVNRPGYLRACQVGPIAPERFANGQLDVVLPAPATLNISIEPKRDAPHDYKTCGVRLALIPKLPDGKWNFPVAERFGDEKSFQSTFDDLAPAEYIVTAHTGTTDTYHDDTRKDFYQEKQLHKLESGEADKARFAMQTFDEAATRAELSGDNTATIKVTRSDGSVPAGKLYRLIWPSHNFGRNLPIKAGTLPDSGIVQVTGLAARMFVFELAGESLGPITLDAAIEDKHQEFEFTLAPRANDMAPNITLTRLDSKETFTLESLRGQVVFLEFWASWCGPCQKPMAEYDAIMKSHADAWAGKALILGASIDDDIQTIQNHVKKRGWTNVLQAHCGDGAWKSAPARAYSLRGVPTACLIDAKGRIVWFGHPAGIDVEQEILKLIKQETE